MHYRFRMVCRTWNMSVVQTRKEGIWSGVRLQPPDEYLAIKQDYDRCKNKKKVNLSISYYQDDNGNSFVLPSIRKAEKLIHSMNLDKEYSPILGDPKFLKTAVQFALGIENEYNNNDLAVSVQTIGGCGALRVGCVLIRKFFPGNKTVYISNPTWINHEQIIKSAGLEVGTYKYYDPTTRDFDFNGMMDDIKKIPDRSVVLLNACAHDPTGIDPNQSQWNELSALIKSKNILPFFDMPYLGLASGDTEQDCYSVRKFIRDGNKVMFAVSFSKNMGLYGERTGCLTVIVNTKSEAAKMISQLKMVVRGLYSSPPINGARIVVKILEDPGLRADWKSECREMADRVISVRRAFKQVLLQLGSKFNWDHFDKSVGLVSTCGLSVEQIEKLMKEHAVFLQRTGRMCIGGLNSKNIDYVTKCFHEVTK